jgi:ribosomal protein L31
MEKFVNILTEINKTREAIKTAKAKENELLDYYMSMSDLKEQREAKKVTDNDIIKISERKQDLQITLKILQNNAKIALFNEVMPVALEVLSKYNGKPYGTKTRQKISDEIKEKTNCRFYISSCYGLDSFDIYPSDASNEYSINCGTENQKQILIDNKIQPVKFEEVHPYYIGREYVTDIPQRVETLKSLYKDAVAKQEELKAICDNFNKLAVGINHIYYDKRLYKNIEL